MADTPAHTHAVTLKVTSPYNKFGVATHTWSMKFALSGADLDDSADAEALVLALFAEIAPFIQPQSSLTSALYYKAGQIVNSYSFEWTSGTHPGLGDAFSGNENFLQYLEVCLLLTAPLTNNSKGKMKYLRKFVHDTVGESNGSGQIITPSLATAGTSALSALSNGFGENNYIVVDPKDGSQPSGPWIIRPYLVTRQLRRSPKA